MRSEKEIRKKGFTLNWLMQTAETLDESWIYEKQKEMIDWVLGEDK